MIRKIAVVAAALSLLLSGAAEAEEPLYPPEPPVTVVKVIKTVDKKVVAQKGALPRTGADTLPLTQIGAGLLAVGAVLALLERNRRVAQAHGDRIDVG